MSKSKCTKHSMPGPLLEVEMSKKCTPLWHEAHFEVKMYKTHTMLGPFLEVEMSKKCTPLWREAYFEVKMCKHTPCSDHFWKLRCRKSARRCGAKHMSKSKCAKHLSVGKLLEVALSKKCTPLWCEAHFEGKMFKNTICLRHFWTLRCRFAWQGKGLWTLSKVIKTWGVCSISKKDGRRGTFEEDLQRCIFRGRRNTRDMFIRAVRRSGRWFPEKGCILEPLIFRFAEMILRDRCSPSYDLASLFGGRRNTLDRWNAIYWYEGRLLCTQISIFEGCLAELLRCWCCQVQKLRKSRWIAAFLMLSSLKTEAVSQDSFVFKLADR